MRSPLPHAGGALLCMAAVACSREEAARAETHPPEGPVTVQVAEVRRGSLQPVSVLAGQIEVVPENETWVSAAIGGRLQSVHVREGQEVSDGTLAFEIDPRPLEAELAGARAELAQREAALERAVAGARPQELARAEASLHRAETVAAARRQKLEAARPMAEGGEMSPAAFAQLEAAVRESEADAAVAAAERDLLAAGTRPESVREARALRDASAAAVARLELELEYGSISVPAGRILELSVRAGQVVSAGDRLARVVDTSQVFAAFRVPTAILDRLQPGTRVHVALPSRPGLELEGRVDRTSPRADATTGRVTAFVLLANPDGALQPGLACRLTVTLPPVTDVLTVPVEALADEGERFVVTVVEAGRARSREVEVGVRAEGRVEIRAGLEEGETVAVEGGYGLPDGQPVTVQEAARELSADASPPQE